MTKRQYEIIKPISKLLSNIRKENNNKYYQTVNDYSKEKEWLKDKVVYFNNELLWNLNPDKYFVLGLKPPVGWMYKKEYDKFKHDYGVEPTFTWKPIPNDLTITKEITKRYENNNRH